MSRSIKIPDELADALADEASRREMSLPDYAVRLLSSAHSPSTAPHNGADLVGFWLGEGLVGSRTDIAESQAHARELREQAQRRDP